MRRRAAPVALSPATGRLEPRRRGLRRVPRRLPLGLPPQLPGRLPVAAVVPAHVAVPRPTVRLGATWVVAVRVQELRGAQWLRRNSRHRGDAGRGDGGRYWQCHAQGRAELLLPLIRGGSPYLRHEVCCQLLNRLAAVSCAHVLPCACNSPLHSFLTPSVRGFQKMVKRNRIPHVVFYCAGAQ